MKILLLGANGQVGMELRRSLCILGNVKPIVRADIELEDTYHLPSMLEKHRADVIVNAAAYTDVDKAEAEPERAFRVNAEAADVIAQHCKKNGALLVHYSTDYVFDGTKPTPYTEDDIPNPINVYGKSKLAGEEAIRASGCRHLIFRTSWVYGVSSRNSFPMRVLQRAISGEAITVDSEQIGSPTSAELIADVSALALHFSHSGSNIELENGIYHLTASGAVSRQNYAKHLLHVFRLLIRNQSGKFVNKADRYGTSACRPMNCVLSSEKLMSILEVKFPQWENSLDALV